MARSRQGTIRVIKGRIYGRVRWTDDEGDRHERLLPASTRSEARRLVNELLAGLEKNEPGIRGNKRTFREVALEYERVHCVPPIYAQGRKIRGIASYKWVSTLVRRAADYFGDTPIQSITRADIEEFRFERFKAPVMRHATSSVIDPNRERTFRSVNYDLQIVRQIFTFAENNNWLITSPHRLFSKLISAADETRRERVLSDEEERRLIEHCSGIRLHIRPIIIAAIDTLLRNGSLLKLCWKDVDLEKRMITTRARTTKTLRLSRHPISKRLLRELRRLYELSTQDPESSVFGIKNNFTHGFKTACRLAGIEKFRFHDLRATGVMRLLQAGCPEEVVRLLSAHTRADVLRRHYERTDESLLKSVAELQDRLHGESESQEVPSNDLVN
jgi:integrase